MSDRLAAAEAELERLREQRDDALKVAATAALKLERLRERLRWIADPFYVGNYAPPEVIEIYRKWAELALAGRENP